VKCPKCHYLGFDTGDRCKNCGYEFSLLGTASEPAAPPLDLVLRPAREAPEAEGPALPLFRDDPADDEPLVKVGVPRPPVAVRRTPEAQRVRLRSPAAPAPSRSSMQESVFEFATEGGDEPAGLGVTEQLLDRLPAAPRRVPDASDEPIHLPVAAPDPAWHLRDPVVPLAARAAVPSDPGPAIPVRLRLTAALIDFGLLLAIDLLVVHFTLRLTALTWADLRVLPALPLLAFLVGLKLAYLTTFTFSGGQTIGKMATGIKVVAEDDGPLTGWQAIERSLVELASVAAVGLPFAVLALDRERRGLHDRLAHTRVVPQ
jgi:uncharacterized RDD family membrane protein YckC